MRGDTREALVAAATQLLDAGDAEAVTLREVGRLAGVSHNAPYKHFADKEALLSAVAARELADRASRMAAVAHRTDDPREALHAVARTYVSWALSHPARFKLVFGRWAGNTPELHAAADAVRAQWLGLVSAAQRAGCLPAGNPARLAALVHATAHGAADLAHAGHLGEGAGPRALPGRLVDELLECLEEAAVTKGAPGGTDGGTDGGTSPGRSPEAPR